MKILLFEKLTILSETFSFYFIFPEKNLDLIIPFHENDFETLFENGGLRSIENHVVGLRNIYLLGSLKPPSKYSAHADFIYINENSIVTCGL